MKEVAKLETVMACSPNRAHLAEFVSRFADSGMEASPASSSEEAFPSADVATIITTSRVPFVRPADVANLSHPNICGSNVSGKAEATPEAITEFRTVAVDDLEQARKEAGDLIGAESAGLLSWESVVQLGDIVCDRVKPVPRTLFKSNGVAVEDVAVANPVYDKARRSSEYAGTDFEIVKEKGPGER